MSLFDADIPHRPEIVQGLFREGQIVTVAGAYNVGKSPLLAQIGVCAVNGIPWCGRQVTRRHVIHIDFESSLPGFVHNYRNTCRANKVEPPKTPRDIDALVFNGDITNPTTLALHEAIKATATTYKYLCGLLKKNPDSLILLDPAEMLFPTLSISKPEHALKIVHIWRSIFAEFPQAAVMGTYNMRKLDTKAPMPDLIEDPHGWLREISGSNNLLNRSDVRMGMARKGRDDDIRFINGIRRGENFYPMLLLPVEVDNDPDVLGGFRRVSAEKGELKKMLGGKLGEYFVKLPAHFKFNDVAGNGVARSTLSRLLNAAESLGYITKSKGLWVKTESLAGEYVELDAPEDDKDIVVSV